MDNNDHSDENEEDGQQDEVGHVGVVVGVVYTLGEAYMEQESGMVELRVEEVVEAWHE